MFDSSGDMQWGSEWKSFSNILVAHMQAVGIYLNESL